MPDEDSGKTLLATTLLVAVPLAIDEMRPWSTETRLAEIARCAQIIAYHGDDILYRSKKRGDTATGFAALARALAALAYQPGGITFAGQHWCVNHDECRETGESGR